MPDYPTGTVTFLFTDIEGSTRLERTLRGMYRGVLDEHQRLLREAFAAHRGYEVDTQGDSFFVAFGRARDATEAAVAAQRALWQFEWPEGGEVRVRMGLHTGEAEVAEGRYIGHAVHRAARIAAAAHGGQILLSRPTRELVEDDLPSDQGVRELGEQRLRDLPRPEHIYQLLADGLPSEFPPLRTLDEEQFAQAAEARVQRRRSRRQAAIALGAGVLAGAAVLAAVLLLTRDETAVVVDPNSVAVIDPAGNRVVDALPVGREPGPIAAGEGSIWVGNIGDRTLSRLDPGSEDVTTITLDNQTPTGIAVGGGAVWVAHGRVGGVVSRIDPSFNRVVKTIDGIGEGFGSGAQGAAVVAYGGGAVWAAGTDATVSKIDPATNRVVRQGEAAAAARAAAFGEGALWVAGGANQVSAVDPARVTSGAPFTVGLEPVGVAVGAGAVWVVARQARTLTRIERRLGSVTATISVGAEPSAVAYGAGAVWVVNGGSGTVSRIDPESNVVVAEIPIGHEPQGVAVGGGRVWVSVREPG